MCTMTWRCLPQRGREIFFNRDELKTRSQALRPQIFQAENGVRYLAPIDPDGGGTWLAVNEYGLCFALLNRWHETQFKGTKTRGSIITSLAGIQTLVEVEEKVRQMDVSDFSPFTLAVLGDEEHFWEWNGDTLEGTDLQQPLTSSSYCFHEVRNARLAAYTKDLERYHVAEGETPTAFTVRMNRPDAQTWSRSVIRIGMEIHWKYYEEMPNLIGEALMVTTTLDRVS